MKKELIKDRLDKANKKLKPITEKQKAYFISKLKHPFLTKSGVTVCPMCGQHFVSGKKRDEAVECPTCKSKGIIKHNKRIVDDIYYCTTEKVDEFQVIRMYVVYVSYHYDRDFEGKHFYIDFSECYRNLINEMGRVYDYARGLKPFAGYRKDPYDWSKDLHLYKYKFTGYNYYICDQTPFTCYPYGSVQPWLRKRGLTANLNHYDYISPLMLMKELLSNPIAETIVKRKEYRWFHLSRSLLNTMWRQIKICFRNHYYPEDISMWYDTMKMAKEVGFDIMNPKYVCPGDLKYFHDQMMKKKQKLDAKRAHERMLEKLKRKEADIKSYNEWVKRFYPICINGSGFEIRVIPCAEDFFELGEKMHQCLATSEYYNNRESIVLSAWLNGKVIENAEVRMEDFKIIQCFSNHNTFSEYHEQILDLINSNIKNEFLKNKIQLTA